MISEGANALQVKRRMGHEDVRTTFNIYGHLFDDDEDALVERLDRRARGDRALTKRADPQTTQSITARFYAILP